MKRGPAYALLIATGCGTSASVSLELATAPGSTLLDAAQRLRVTLTAPRRSIEAVRGEDGFSLSFEVDATGAAGSLIVEAFDATGNRIASGASPPFGVTGIEARIVVYMAPGLSIEAAPMALATPREAASATRLTYGAIWIGGLDPMTHRATGAVTVYNAFDYSLTEELPMPAARSGAAVGTGTNGTIYILGGRDGDDAIRGTRWRFETSVAPNGTYFELGDETSHARTGEQMVPIGIDRFLISGMPALELQSGGVAERTEITTLGHSAGVTVDGVPIAVFADASGIAQFREGVFANLSTVPRPLARAVALPDGAVLVVDAGELVRVDAATGELAVMPATGACASAEVAATPRHVLVGCGDRTFVYDARSLAQLATIDVGGTSYVALPNDQILLLRGAQPYLFSPPPPEL